MGAFSIGALIVVCASDDFYRFIDGWKGKVTGYKNGLNVITCINPDGQEVEFYVPDSDLRMDQ